MSIRRLARRLRTSVALGLPPVLAPAMVFVPLGVLLGPWGTDVLDARVVGHLEPVVSILLATFGVLAGLALRDGPGRRVLVGASLESGLTIVVVAAAAWYAAAHWAIPLSAPAGALALMLGVAAATSSTGFEDTRPDAVPGPAARMAELDDVLPILVGGAALAWLQTGSPWGIARLLLGNVLVGIAVGVVGLLLIERAQSTAERALFVLGTLTLAGGAASHLGLSPLVAGFVAGLIWRHGPGRIDEIVARDVQPYQHPLVVLLLIAAGASLVPSREALWLVVPFVALRVGGKLAGGWLGARVAGLPAGAVGTHLLAPGLMGLAFAVAAAEVVSGTDGAVLVTAVVLGTLAAEVLALGVAPPSPQDAAPPDLASLREDGA
jgi:hypothetical protein